jgi:hypothetical protein
LERGQSAALVEKATRWGKAAKARIRPAAAAVAAATSETGVMPDGDSHHPPPVHHPATPTVHHPDPPTCLAHPARPPAIRPLALPSRSPLADTIARCKARAIASSADPPTMRPCALRSCGAALYLRTQSRLLARTHSRRRRRRPPVGGHRIPRLLALPARASRPWGLKALSRMMQPEARGLRPMARAGPGPLGPLSGGAGTESAGQLASCAPVRPAWLRRRGLLCCSGGCAAAAARLG